MKVLNNFFKFTICCIICISVLGCTNQSTDSTREDNNTQNQQLESEMYKGKDEMIPGIGIDTPYGSLYFSEEWYDYLKIDITEDDQLYKVDFYADYKSNKFLLFSLVYGSSTSGTLLGIFENSEQDGIPVYLQMNDLEIPKDFPEESVDSVYAMREEVNNICDQIYKQGFFVKK